MIATTLFSDYAAAEKDERSLTVDQLADMIRAASAPVKGSLPGLKFARFGNALSQKGSLRHDRNVICITSIEADYDGEVVSFDAAVEIAEKAGL